jgi:hypothetical protein
MSNDTRLRKARSLAKQANRLARLATEIEHLEDEPRARSLSYRTQPKSWT